jgi:hypothetical protein
MCVICGKRIEQGEQTAWVSLPTYSVGRVAHFLCVERDWEALEAGLEQFPVLSSSRTLPIRATDAHRSVATGVRRKSA